VAFVCFFQVSNGVGENVRRSITDLFFYCGQGETTLICTAYNSFRQVTASEGLLFTEVLLITLGTCRTEQASLLAERVASERSEVEQSSCIVATNVDVAVNARNLHNT
jgi:hypothetical protein